MAGGEFVFSGLERQHVAVGRVYFTVVPRDRLRDLEVVLPARDMVSNLTGGFRLARGREGGWGVREGGAGS